MLRMPGALWHTMVSVTDSVTKYQLYILSVVYYPDQQMHNIYIYIYNILYIVSTSTCFDASGSSSGRHL